MNVWAAGPSVGSDSKTKEEALCGNNNIGFETEHSTGPGGLRPESSSLSCYGSVVVRTYSGGGSASHHCPHTHTHTCPVSL